MQRIMKATIFVLVFLTICVIATVPAKAQQGKDVLPAPLPSQVVNARKIFIANAGAENALLYNGGPPALLQPILCGDEKLGPLRTCRQSRRSRPRV